jgi:UDP-glucose 4-epimerase
LNPWTNLLSDSSNQSRPSCIVLGGGGFIGMNLCRRLAASGHRVRAFGRRCQFVNELQGAEWFQGDFTDHAALAEAIENFNIVFHLVHSATPQAANLDMAEDVQRNVIPSLGMLEICRKLGVARVVFVSSGGTVYGRTRQIPTPETAPAEPITAYGISKLAIEKYLGLYEYLHGLSYRILRVANPYGPFQLPAKNQGVIAALVSRASRDEAIEIWGDGSVVRDFIFIDDVVDALMAAAADRSSAQVFNIGSSRGRSLREVMSAIEQVMGTTLKIIWKPARPVDVPVSVVAVERAKELLHWAPKTSFENGLEQTIKWWQSRAAIGQ